MIRSHEVFAPDHSGKVEEFRQKELSYLKLHWKKLKTSTGLMWWWVVTSEKAWHHAKGQTETHSIDNFKESMLNLTFGCFDKIELKAMEHVLWMLVTIVRCMRLFGEVSFVLSDGEVLRGRVHPSWNKVAFVEATCMDMKSAYKQLYLNPCVYPRTVVSLWDVQQNKPSCFLMRTLPFGAAASVHHFLRVSSFLHAVGVHAGLCWGAYFDDFPLMCSIANRQSTLSTALGIFELLGFACNDEKLEPFGKVATMLGVELDLQDTGDGLSKAKPPERRKSRAASLRFWNAESSMPTSCHLI